MVRPTKIKNQPRNVRKNVYFTQEEYVQVEMAAAQAGMLISVFLRDAALAREIRPARALHAQELVRELHRLGVDLNRIGNNLNQLARHANTYGSESSVAGINQNLNNLEMVIAAIVDAIKKV